MLARAYRLFGWLNFRATTLGPDGSLSWLSQPHVMMFLSTAKKITVLVIGSSVVLFGIALIVLPGPAFVVIPTGLAILATEFAWARRFLQHVRQRVVGVRAPELTKIDQSPSEDPVQK